MPRRIFCNSHPLRLSGGVPNLYQQTSSPTSWERYISKPSLLLDIHPDITMRSSLFCFSVGLLVLGENLPRTSGQKVTGDTPSTPTLDSFPPPSEKLPLQETVSITCRIQGSFPGEANIRWFRNAKAAATSVNSISKPERPENFRSSLLHLNISEWDDEATYFCAMGKETFPSLTLQQVPDQDPGKPSASNKSLFRSRFQEAKEDSSVILRCVVEGPHPDNLSITWHENGRPLTGDNSVIHTSSEPNVFLNSSLKISGDAWNSAKAFSCAIGQQNSPHPEHP